MFGGWNKIFNRQIIDVHGGTWGDVTYYILAAQTIYYKYHLTKQVFADHPRSVGAWRRDKALKYWRV
jgi:hypothetical protein